MNIVILHTDFRLYWPARIRALQMLLSNKGIDLYPIEISGKGSPYAFSKKNTDTNIENWHILFPERDMESLRGSEISKLLVPLLNKLQPEIVIAGAIAFPSGALAVSWCKQHKKKVVIFDDARIEDVQRNRMVNYVKKHIYQNVDAMLYPAPEWEETGKYWGFSAKQLFYGIDVVDNGFWNTTCIETKEKYFITVGRLIEKKNILFTVKAYQKLKEANNDLPELWIIGEGPEKERIKSFIQTNKIEGIKLMPFQSQAQLSALYQNSQAMIISSNKSETWGLVINEAMASGIPVIASQHCGATSSLVKDGINGYIFDPYNLQSLIEKWELFINQTEQEREEMGRQSSEIIKEWNLDKFTEATYNCIEYVLKTRSTRCSWIDFFILKLWKGRYNPV